MIVTPITLFASPYAMKLDYIRNDNLALMEPILFCRDLDYTPPHKQTWLKKFFRLYSKPEIMVPKELAIDEFTYLPLFRLNKKRLNMSMDFDVVYAALDMNSYYVKDGDSVRLCGCANNLYYVFTAPKTASVSDLTIADAFITDKWVVALADLFNIRLFVV